MRPGPAARLSCGAAARAAEAPGAAARDAARRRTSRSSAPTNSSDWRTQIKDANYRVFVAGGEVHVVSRGLHLHDADPFALFEQLRHSGPDGALPKNLDAAHAFYLGYEMCKAATALALGKQYRQDEALDWGFLTREEARHYLRELTTKHEGHGSRMSATTLPSC